MDIDHNVIDKLLANGAVLGETKQTPGLICYAVLPPGYSVVSLEHLQEKPTRVKQTVVVHDADSFIKYFTDYVQPDSRIFVSLQPPQIIGILDYHQQLPAGEGGALWGDHKVTFGFKHTKEWATWTGHNKKAMSQAEFAQFIEDNLPDVVDPSPAAMTDVSRTLEVKKGVNFSSANRLSDGEVQFSYEEEIKGTVAKGNMIVPETFKIALHVFEPGLPGHSVPPYIVTARFRYRIKENGLTLWYELVRPHKTLEDAVAQIVLKIKAGVNNPVTLGSI